MYLAQARASFWNNGGIGIGKVCAASMYNSNDDNVNYRLSQSYYGVGGVDKPMAVF